MKVFELAIKSYGLLFFLLGNSVDLSCGLLQTTLSSAPSPVSTSPSLLSRGGDLLNNRQYGGPHFVPLQKSSSTTTLSIRGGGSTTKTSLASSSSSSSTTSGGLDFGALSKYILALAVQMSLFYGLFVGIDKFVVPRLGGPLPMFLNIPIFYIFALKSRMFNPLSNQRPKPATKEIETKDDEEEEAPRVMPSWTPPGFIFPIVWLLLIGPLRAVTSSMVVKTTGTYANNAVLALMLHLSIGDVWNTINNVERRYGTSVLGVLGVYSSAAYAARKYHGVLPLAGKLLALKLIWLTIATSLIIRTWQLNPNPATGKPYSLLPKKGEGAAETKLIWFFSSSSE